MKPSKAIIPPQEYFECPNCDRKSAYVKRSVRDGKALATVVCPKCGHKETIRSVL